MSVLIKWDFSLGPNTRILVKWTETSSIFLKLRSATGKAWELLTVDLLKRFFYSALTSLNPAFISCMLKMIINSFARFLTHSLRSVIDNSYSSIS